MKKIIYIHLFFASALLGASVFALRASSDLTSLQHLAAQKLIDHPAHLAQQLEALHAGLYDQRFSIPAASISKAVINRISIRSTQLRGHKGEVSSLAFNSEGTLLASGSYDTTIRLWNLATGKTELIVPAGSKNSSIAYAPDGTRIASADCEFGFSCMYCTTTGKELCVIRHHNISCFAFNPSGTILAMASRGDPLFFLDPQTGKRIIALGDYHEEIFSVEFSPDGTMLASSSPNGLCVWDVQAGKLRQRFSDDEQYPHVSRAIFSPDGTTIASIAATHVITLWDVATGKRRDEIHLNYANPLFAYVSEYPRISCIAFSPDGSTLALGLERGPVLLLNSFTRRTLHAFNEHTQRISSVKFSPDGGTLVAASADTTISIWKLNYLQELLNVTDIEEQRFLLTAAQDWRAHEVHVVCKDNLIYQELIKRFAFLDDERLFTLFTDELQPKVLTSSSPCLPRREDPGQ